MNVARLARTPKRYRASSLLGNESGQVAPADLLTFAEKLIREAVGPAMRPTAFTVQLLKPVPSSTKVTGDAACLSEADATVWRVSISDGSGTLLADVTVTLSTAQAPQEKAEPQRKSRRDSEARKDHIARAARDVFADKGYAAATMREIAAAAGMHVPTMYQYFRSKEELLELVYWTTITQAVEDMDGVLSAEGPASERMDAIVRRLHDVNQELRRGTLVMNRETRSLSRPARDRVLGRYATMVDRIVDVVAEGQAEGVFRSLDPKLAAVFIDALADVWVLRPFAVGHTDFETYAAELAAFVRGALVGGAAHRPDQPESLASNRRKKT